MYISYFTPTHDLSFLTKAYASLVLQTNPNWEWVIYVNGAAVTTTGDGLVGTLPPGLAEDKRVRVLMAATNAKQPIGLLKSVACRACSGDVMAELDHDDELSWDCTETLINTHAAVNADFYYSHTVECDGTGKSRAAYAKALGWLYSTVKFNGRDEIQTHAFPPSPAVFSRIWYAPNHIRAWKSSFYRSIGGHNVTLSILDDQELMIRTYLKGTVHLIDKALYQYNLHDRNTCLQADVNPGIQSQTLRYHETYALDLAAHWADANCLGKLDICCWKNKVRPSFTGVDINANADVCADLNQTWPFADNSIGVVYAHDALEHLRSALHTMSEIHRVLAPGGWLISDTPSTDGRGAFQDPTHVSFWNSNSFWYYTQANTAVYIDAPVRFQRVHCANYWPTEWHKTNNIPYVRADLIKLTGLKPEERRLIPGTFDI